MRRAAAVCLGALWLAGCAAPRLAEKVGFGASMALSALPGWASDHVADAMPALLRGCARLALTPPDQTLGGGAMARNVGQAGDWTGVCTAARAVPPGDDTAARAFLAERFQALRLTDAAEPTGLFTGYYEPEISGSREKTRTFSVAVMGRPADLVDRIGADGVRRFGRMQDGQLVAYYTRAEIDAGALRRQRLDLLYLRTSIDLFFLQMQGSGRIDLPNGHVVRVGYGAGNGQPYVPIGRVLSQNGQLAADDVSAQTIRDWLQTHPAQARATMELNPSYTFFRELPSLSPGDGPLGTLGVQLTPLRSIAVDPTQIPLGAPVWIDTIDADGRTLQRLMLAQDTGSAVAGAVRADLFYGWGTEAEARAGRMQAPGQAWLLLPKTASLPGT